METLPPHLWEKNLLQTAPSLKNLLGHLTDTLSSSAICSHGSSEHAGAAVELGPEERRRRALAARLPRRPA